MESNSSDLHISFMNLIDLDETVVDERLKNIMNRKYFSENHLKNAFILLQYKFMINLQENSECDNSKEFDFVVKILSLLDNDNIDHVCKIINTVLSLNYNSLTSMSEHLLQQVLCDMDMNPENVSKDNVSHILRILKIMDVILECLDKNKKTISLMYLEIPLENFVLSTAIIRNHFLAHTIPKFVKVVRDYNILDKVWNTLTIFKGNKYVVLSTLCCLSDYYLPNNKTLEFKSDLISQSAFWETVLFGMHHSDHRKMSIYLAKRAIDYLLLRKQDIELKNSLGLNLFNWKHVNEIKLKRMWDDYFVLIESLEEKQSNIVLPSLKLFDKLIDFGDDWVQCAFELGLKHDNTVVRKKCIDNKLNYGINNIQDAKSLLDALNDNNLYDHDYGTSMEQKLQKFMSNKNLEIILNVFHAIKWSPAPLFYMSSIMKGIYTEDLPNIEGNLEAIHNILKVDCNNLIIKEIVLKNMVYFICNTFSNLEEAHFVKILPLMLHNINNDLELEAKVMSWSEKILSNNREMVHHFMNSSNYIDFILLHLKTNPDLIPDYMICIQEKLSKIHNITSRHYASYTECMEEFLYMAMFIERIEIMDKLTYEHMQHSLDRDYRTLISYLLKLFNSEDELVINDIMLMTECSTNILQNYQYYEVNDLINKLYRISMLTLNEETCLELQLLSTNIIKNITTLTIIKSDFKHEVVNLKTFLETLVAFSKLKSDSLNEKKKNTGKFTNKCYENISETLYEYVINYSFHKDNMEMFIIQIDNIIERGGYGCLTWILKIVNSILHLLLNEENKKYFDFDKFLSRCWSEIEELKSNKQYLPCINEFVNIITNDAVLKQPIYNNTFISYCRKIIDYGSLSYTPLYYLIDNIRRKNISNDLAILVYVLSEILLFCPIPKKSIRLMDNTIQDILNVHCNKYKIKASDSYHFYYEIQNMSVQTLTKIEHAEIFDTIQSNMIMKIDAVLKNKQRYHKDTQTHRIILLALQHFIFISLTSPRTMLNILPWCVELIGKLPHQLSVRFCMEWYISLYFLVENKEISRESFDNINLNRIPLLSQFIVLYNTLKHKILNNEASSEEYHFVLDFLLSHSMGQLFNIRLHAQYLAYEIYKLNNKLINNTTKFDYAMDLIQHTFKESSEEQAYIKLCKDFLINKFDIIECLTPKFIYYFLPKYCDVGRNEVYDVTMLPTLPVCEKYVARCNSNKTFIEKWLKTSKFDDNGVEIESYLNAKVTGNDSEHVDSTLDTIQKKYIPWKNMTDVFAYGKEDSNESKKKSDLIVCATLIDKLPNLGGLARTSEVFGVKTYVVDNLRHLLDKQFQGLSVSAERWVNIEEVRPGRPLKDYLLVKKNEGYHVVAAEQTSSSVKLQDFKFPKKSLLLLGHEKEGIPCDLLPLMDYCVEIPQRGFVRSLNVHVTAAIFVWEYTKQNLL